ncbi:MAG: Stk1 family PASTA domain-containing Ser/Thr kinase [Butyrivibrio sp.]|nr:Stk1 family PASTA domain-containing Ser/Thr kinase [Butyrivibrio sp.]
MVKIGMMIGGRYEILEKIGTGGMSDVYKSKDHKLNRFVAVKVLKQEFSENENFVSKFRVEAQAAAGLMHPNIVNVYDVGDEDGIYYIVMELVEGITLKKYIEKKSRLTVKEAVSIAIQVAMGLEAAHNNHIIHRDIKPQNIIISKEGKVKVTDFGIAKAATSNTITSNVMGSVHYTSPEQARGGYSDAKSDIYSLGITLFEMLTGRVPFNGDTTVAIAIKHIQEELPSPHTFNDEIPISVEKIVLKCCQKSPDRRYQSAVELISDLKRSLITPEEDFVDIVDPDEEGATRVVSSNTNPAPSSLSDTEQMRLKQDVINEEMKKRKERKERYSEERYSDEFDEDESDDGEDTDNMEKLTIALAVVAAILVGVIVVVMVGRAFGFFGGGSDNSTVIGISTEQISKEDAASGSNENDTVSIVIPDVTGQSYAEAKSNLEAKGFTVVKEASSENTKAKNVVESQKPEGGSSAASGETVTVYVSDGSGSSSATTTADSASATEASSASTEASTENESGLISMPNLIGMSEEDAYVTLIEAGLTPGKVIETTNEDTNLTGLICAQSEPVGAQLEAGTTINMELSTGPANVSYSYSADISAPTEGENYTSGLSVNVSLVTADGTQLLSTTTTSFPISVSYTGITSSTGVLTFTYTANGPATTNEAGETVAGTAQQYTVTRAVTFTQEN